MSRVTSGNPSRSSSDWCAWNRRHASTAHAQGEHVLDGHPDPALGGHVRQRLDQPAAVGRLPAVGRVHDDERRPDAERELDRPVDLPEGVAAPHPAGHQEERRVHREDGERVVLGERPDACRVLRVGVVRHHQLDPVEPGPREQRERGVDRLGEDRDRRADDRRSVVGHAAMLAAVSAATAMLRGHVGLPPHGRARGRRCSRRRSCVATSGAVVRTSWCGRSRC